MANILVAGGGIGGLAAALSIARHGHHVLVAERNRDFRELGAGIQLAPNAFHALDLLGVGADVRATAVYIDELRLMDGTTGERITSMPLTGEYRQRFGNPYAVVQRGDLYQPLLSACRDHDNIELRTDSQVTAYEQDSGGVTAVLASGSRLSADLLVGADGIRSAVRRQLVGDGAPRVSGHTIYRCVIPMSEVPPQLRSNSVTLWAGPKWHMVHYPIGNGRFFNMAITRDDAATEVVVGEPVETPHVHARFPVLSEPARRLLELGKGWRTWVLCDRDPVADWTDGRVVLLGDAAHPMLQYAAQGACQALEDAVVLGDLLDHGADEFAACALKYNAVRRDRTARAQHVSREMGSRLFHPSGVEAKARNDMLSSLSATDLHDEVSWLHGARDFTDIDQLTGKGAALQ
ncbi:3-hydroxybenzoate 6-monooxygenase [Lentzea sp. NEAU-D7]|uniref:3-hydroxybenzoate 6-monooxygenase n=1 Tax=Lentzea sp. NEAU-D7 TaxID=2994667 RepID=UPI00224A8AB1|nr:3-hydroxybenzoate 6-monooxygenase [Lentzea sp. NEAU-D7]MCX2953924.1 3-hydroxybenzoate 6-monooxygenase [Lentzea sp. NEAU-D7]